MKFGAVEILLGLSECHSGLVCALEMVLLRALSTWIFRGGYHVSDGGEFFASSVESET